MKDLALLTQTLSIVIAFRVSCFEMPSFLILAVLLGAADELWAAEVYCPGLGNYSNEAPFDRFPLPDCPEAAGINTKVYTRENRKIGETITRDTIPSCYKSGMLTIFIVHGWDQNENYTWLHDTKDAFLDQGDYNVIIVGWGIGAAYYFYPRSASDTRTVGGEIALISNNTIKRGKSSRPMMYCVGHSLGAHACGHAGMQGQFGRITGLDPAGPFFEGNDVSIGLNPSCADLVDVIHTNGLAGLGLFKPCGHIDFYPNGGTNQPGCTSDSTTEMSKWTNYLNWDADQQEASLQFAVACSHMRACDYYKESIVTPSFISRSHCSSTTLLSLPMLCSSDVLQNMGFSANKYSGRGIFYLKTNSITPFCRG